MRSLLSDGFGNGSKKNTTAEEMLKKCWRKKNKKKNYEQFKTTNNNGIEINQNPSVLKFIRNSLINILCNFKVVFPCGPYERKRAYLLQMLYIRLSSLF
jgi:hypothetical protein